VRLALGLYGGQEWVECFLVRLGGSIAIGGHPSPLRRGRNERTANRKRFLDGSLGKTGAGLETERPHGNYT
jgi:hypothetical protein